MGDPVAADSSGRAGGGQQRGTLVTVTGVPDAMAGAVSTSVRSTTVQQTLSPGQSPQRGMPMLHAVSGGTRKQWTTSPHSKGSIFAPRGSPQSEEHHPEESYWDQERPSEMMLSTSGNAEVDRWIQNFRDAADRGAAIRPPIPLEELDTHHMRYTQSASLRQRRKVRDHHLRMTLESSRVLSESGEYGMFLPVLAEPCPRNSFAGEISRHYRGAKVPEKETYSTWLRRATREFYRDKCRSWR